MIVLIVDVVVRVICTCTSSTLKNMSDLKPRSFSLCSSKKDKLLCCATYAGDIIESATYAVHLSMSSKAIFSIKSLVLEYLKFYNILSFEHPPNPHGLAARSMK